MKALITGGAGFMGFHLSRRLAQMGWRVDLLDNLARGVVDRDLEELLARPGVRLLEADLLEPGQLTGLGRDYTVIFHLAAIIGVRHVLERPFQVLADNTRMLLHVLELAQGQSDLKRLVFASTSEVYAGALANFSLPIPTPERAPLAIGDPAQARTSYALSKIYGEALCQQAGLPFTILRPHNVYGPRMGLVHVIPELLQRAHQAPPGGELEVFSVDHRRTFCYVDDAVEMLVRTSQSQGCLDETLNLGRQEPEVSIGELARLVLDTVNQEMAIKPLPATPGSPARRAPEMTKTTALTGFSAGIGLERGLELTYAWYRSRVFDAAGPSAL
jgi:UDP-glucuronate decarboxylase